MERGELWWADLGEPRGSGPAYLRPVLVIQSERFNHSRIGTVISVAVTSNLALADAPGNVRLPKRSSGLPKDSVVNVSQLVTLNRAELVEYISMLSSPVMAKIDAGLRLVLDL